MPSASVVDAADFAEARSALLQRTFRAATDVLSPWFGEAVLCDSLAAELDRDMEVAAGHEQTEDVRLVQLHQAEPRWIVAQLNQRNSSRPAAEVTVKHRSFDIESDADIEAISDAARAAFPCTPVERVCVRRFESAADPIPGEARLHTSYVAALIRDLHLPSAMELAANLRIESAATLAFYEEYESWYREFWRRRPELTKHVPIETREDLERCMVDDGVRLIYVGDEFCGVLAAIPHIEFGLKGWRMREKVIAPAFWGRALSAPATVLFARSLPSRPDDAIWGTIVPGNRASMRSAKLIGRRTIGSLYRLDRVSKQRQP